MLRRLLISACAATFAAVALPAVSAQALGQCAAPPGGGRATCEHRWFADPELTDQIGYLIQGCNGVTMGGVRQGYYQLSSRPCP